MKVKVTCPSCGRVTELDPQKIPPKPVTFGCPGCKTKVPVDGAAIHRGEAPAPAPAPVVAPPAAAPPAAVAQVAVHAPTRDPDDEFDLIAHLEMPEGTELPSGLAFADDLATLGRLQEVLAPYGCELRPCAEGAREIRAIASVNLPEMIVYVANALPAPPVPAMEPLLGLEPHDRRRTFFLVVADNVKTMDGNSAFFHGVDLLVSKQDLARADRVLYSALEFRRTLCGPFLDALAEVEGA